MSRAGTELQSVRTYRVLSCAQRLGELPPGVGEGEGWLLFLYFHCPDQVSSFSMYSVHPSCNSGFWPKVRLSFQLEKGTEAGQVERPEC